MKKKRMFFARGGTIGFEQKIGLKMRLTLLLLVMGFLNLMASESYSQMAKLTILLQNVSVEQVLVNIENNSEFNFVYNRDVIDLERKVNVNYRDEKVNDILDDLFKDTNVTYRLIDRTIVLSTVSKSVANAQPTTISGKVTDSSGSPLPGVTVVVKGTTRGTITDADGNYSVSSVPEEATLVFSFVGMKTQEIPVAGKTTIDVVMAEDAFGIEEVVAVGYGTYKKATLTSSVASVDAEEIEKNTVADVSNAIGGKAPGVITRNFRAEPGSDETEIFIRGVSTTGNNEALIVIDGIPDRDLSDVDISDIESISILKDASAVAPYGSRGANGVVLITTKRGKTGKPTINYNFYYGLTQPTRLPEFASSANYARMFNEASINEGKEESFSAEEIALYEAGTNPNYPNTQWFDEITQGNNPVQTKHNMSVSGANDNLNYYLAIGMLRQDGFFDKVKFNRYNVRANIDATITKDLTVSFDLMCTKGNKNTFPGDGSKSVTEQFIGSPLRIPSIWPVKTPDGKYFVDSGVAGNPVAQIELGGYTKIKSNTFNGTLRFEYKPSYINGLTLKVLGTHDYSDQHNKSWKTPYSTWRLVDRANGLYEEIPPTLNPSLSETSSFSELNQFEFHLNYEKTIAVDHNFKALFVYNVAEWKSNWLYGSRINYLSSAIDQIFAGPSENQSTGGSASEGARMGYVGRLTYDYKSKYLFEGNFRYDGSMNFAPGQRWGFFPSFAVGWRISEENFIKNNYPFIDNLKLRGSWGQAGNDRVGSYQYLATYGFGSPYVFGGTTVQTADEARLPNSDITWETASMTDIGIEASLWGNLINFEGDYFFKRTKDILRPTQKSSSIIGISLPDANIGIVESQGFEFLVGHRKQVGEFKYYVNFVYTLAKNKAIELAEAEGTLNDPFRKQTGRQLNAYFGYIAEGLFTSEEEIENAPYHGDGIVPGDIKYRDFSGPDFEPDGIIDFHDQTKIGYAPIPEVIFGSNLEVEFRSFDLSLYFQGATRTSYQFDSFAANAFDNGGNIQKWQMENRWTPENNDPNARYPRLTTAPKSNNTRASTYWLRDGTYLRLKNAQLGYNLNRRFLTKINIQKFRVFLSAQNLFTWTKDKLFTLDPEATNSRGRFYPQSIVYSAGINVTF